jgi:hypothetical protein
MKRITEAQIRQIVREEIINEIRPYVTGPVLGMRTPEERKREHAYMRAYDPNDPFAPVVDKKLFTKPKPSGKTINTKKFFNILEGLKDEEVRSRYGQEILLLKIDYDAMDERSKQKYNDKDSEVLTNNNKNFLKIRLPSQTDTFTQVELPQELFDKIKSLLKQS